MKEPVRFARKFSQITTTWNFILILCTRMNKIQQWIVTCASNDLKMLHLWGITCTNFIVHSNECVLKLPINVLFHVLGVWTCDICLKPYSSQTNLNIHIRTVHQTQDEATLTCEYCSKKFKNSNSKRVHIYTYHRWFKCVQIIWNIHFKSIERIHFHLLTYTHILSNV